VKSAVISLLAISLALATASVQAADGPQTLAIRAGKILTVTAGVVENGIIVVRNGKVDGVGQGLQLPADAQIIDAQAMTVAPGFIDAHCCLGLSLNPFSEADELVRPVTAEMQVLDAFDAASADLDEAVRCGVTVAILAPGSRNPIGGQLAAVKLSGGRPVLERTVGLKLSFADAALMQDRRPTSQPGLITLIQEHLDKARAYRPGEFDASAEVLSRLTQRRLTAFAYANTVDEITAALQIIDQYGLKAILVGAQQADEVADLLAKRDIPVIYGPLLLQAKDKDLRRVAKLAAAGVKIAFSSFAPASFSGDIRTSAILAVRYGLRREAALQALTSCPAAMLGLSARLGGIRKGGDADLIVLDGDPLEASSRIEMVLIDGKIVYQRKQP
jgi:imidazolonepropionase-like amidohydrolase